MPAGPMTMWSMSLPPVADLDGVEHSPVRSELLQLLGDHLFAFGADAPVPLVGLHAEHPGHQVENRRLGVHLIALGSSTCAGSVAGEVAWRRRHDDRRRRNER
jgi:hypothetical protein